MLDLWIRAIMVFGMVLGLPQCTNTMVREEYLYLIEMCLIDSETNQMANKQKMLNSATRRATVLITVLEDLLDAAGECVNLFNR